MTSNETINRIESDAHSFDGLINYIRFPYFRNLAADVEITFDSPFTVFVGQNGCGKSSALQALYGAPEGYSLGDYWFTTVVDPIPEEKGGERHCFIYSHSGQGRSCEVLKTRIFRQGKPELWDTSEAMLKYKMANPGKRTSAPVKKEVVFINFRATQNAFERKFHEERPPRNGVQNELRDRAVHLAKAFENKFKDGRFTRSTPDIPIEFGNEELYNVNQILGKSYKSARLLRHGFFGRPGYSVMMTTDQAKYSEAFAGSGEFAVFLLVHELKNAPNGCLLLLDEPEISLHPGAQKNLQHYLIQQCLRKKLQVVICTHSPPLIQGLPPRWIKVFRPDADGKFHIINEATPTEAFHFIGENLPAKAVIHVEDKLAKHIVEVVAKQTLPDEALLFDVVYTPGGKDQLIQDSLVYSRDINSKHFIIFDKDVDPGKSFEAPDKIPQGTYDDPRAVEIKLRKNLGQNFGPVKLPKDSNPPKYQNRETLVAFTYYLIGKVQFFPVDLEAMIWSRKVAENLRATHSVTKSVTELEELGAKERYVEFARIFADYAEKPSGEDIAKIHRLFVAHWLATRGPDFEAIRTLINAVRAQS